MKLVAYISLASALLAGCGPVKQTVSHQHQAVDTRAGEAFRSTPPVVTGVREESGLYLGSGLQKEVTPTILDKAIGGQGMSTRHAKTVVDFASQLSAYIGIPVDVAADVYEKRGDDESTTSVVDSTGTATPLVTATASNNSSAASFPEKITYKFLSSQTLENVITAATNQYGLAWSYDEDKHRFTIYRYETAIFNIPLPNDKRELSMQFDSDTVKANMAASESIHQSILEKVEALASDEAEVKFSGSGLLVISDRPANIATVRDYLDAEIKALTRQVLLQVRLISFDKTLSENYSIDWDLVYNDGHTALNVSRDSTPIIGAVNTGIQVINPTSKFNGTSVDIDALSSDKGVSIEYSNAALSLSSRPVVTSQVSRVAYLKDITPSTASSGDIVQTSLTQDVIETGLSLYMHPTVYGDDVFLSMGVTLSALINLNTATSGGNTIQTPESSLTDSSQVVKLKNGGAIAISGFYVESAEADESGVGKPSIKVFGGASKSEVERRQAVLIITANIVG